MGEDSIYPLTTDHIDEATAIYSAAFLNDPMFAFMLPNKSKRERALKLFFKATVKYSMICDECYGISSPTEGVAIWNRPGKRKISIWGFIQSGFLKLIFTPFIFSLVKSLRLFLKTAKMHKKYTSDPHYYLALLAVHPNSQGKGLAGKLLRPILKNCDEMNVGVYLETMNPKNVPMYEHFGFKVMEELFVQNGLSVWALFRPKKE
jgi:ribosomal protein S18 acetylase RimI-like enzyme